MNGTYSLQINILYSSWKSGHATWPVRNRLFNMLMRDHLHMTKRCKDILNTQSISSKGLHLFSKRNNLENYLLPGDQFMFLITNHLLPDSTPNTAIKILL